LPSLAAQHLVVETRATFPGNVAARGGGATLELAAGRRVEGWAQDVAWPELPQLFEFSAEGMVLGQALTCLHRHDLEDAGIGGGRAHFNFTVAQVFRALPCACAGWRTAPKSAPRRA
jgi:hypothetical protein